MGYHRPVRSLQYRKKGEHKQTVNLLNQKRNADFTPRTTDYIGEIACIVWHIS